MPWAMNHLPPIEATIVVCGGRLDFKKIAIWELTGFLNTVSELMPNYQT